MTKVFYNLEDGVPGVRVAQKKDEGDLFNLLLLLHAENGMFRLNKEKVIKGIQWATERQGGIIFCIDADSHVVASLGMLIISDWYSDDEYLLERWNYVHPNHRQTDYARKLLEQAKWAHERFKLDGLNMPFQCGINSFDRTEAKIRLYARHFPCIGANFMYGEPPYLGKKYQREVARIEDIERRVRGLPRSEGRKVTPVVETVIRLSQQREAEDVRQE